MLKKILTLVTTTLIVTVIIGTVLLSGCIGDNSEPPSYPPRYSEIDVNIGLEYDYPVFYFGDAVQDNGSVNQSKTVNWTLTINNRGNRTEDVRFEIAYFPPELLVWSTELKIFEIRTVEAWAEEEKELFNMTYTYEHILEYDYDDEDFERYYIEDIVSMASVEFTVSITFNETVAWSYSPDTTYVGHFEIRKHAIDPKRGSIFYDELVVPFVVRT